MSKAKIKTADAPNNSYTIDVSGYGTVPAQCVTVDELVTSSEVNIIDQYNIPPDESLSFGNIRILPNSGEYTYSSDKTWKTADELWADNAKASLAKAFFFSCEENPRWQDEYPLYNIGTVTEIIDEKYMWVMCRNNVQRKCRTDYMSCDTAAFSVDDQVAVKFENCDKSDPAVVGFWNEPKSCLWEPWNTDPDDQYNFATTNAWGIAYIHPGPRRPWTMVNGFLDYNITTDHDTWLNDGMVYVGEKIPIPEQKLYFNITSTIVGGGAGHDAYSYLFLKDEHDNCLFVVFSDTDFEGRDWDTAACTGIYTGDNDGKTPIDISCLHGNIKQISIETGYDNDMIGYHHSDFIHFR